MSLLIPSGHRKREAIELIRRCVELFIHPGTTDAQKLAMENYFIWLYNNNRDIDIQAKIEIDGPKLGLGLILTNPPEKKDRG